MAAERGGEWADGMMELSYRRHRFPPVVIQHAVWLYLRFTLSYRDVEDLLAERGLDISYETVRSWVLKFGPVIARRLRRRRPRLRNRWHLDEMVGRIAGERMYLWLGANPCFLRSLRMSRSAARLSRRRCTSISRMRRSQAWDSGTDGSQTLPWREPDSNHRSRVRKSARCQVPAIRPGAVEH